MMNENTSRISAHDRKPHFKRVNVGPLSKAIDVKFDGVSCNRIRMQEFSIRSKSPAPIEMYAPRIYPRDLRRSARSVA